MRKKVVNDLIGTSTEILQTFWHKDMSLLSHYLDDDVFYCGADPNQYYSSKNELVNYFYSVMNGCSESELTHIDLQCVFNQQNIDGRTQKVIRFLFYIYFIYILR